MINRTSTPTLLLLLAFALPLCAADREAEIKTILEGVKEIGAPGSPGALLTFGPEAFTIVTGKSGDSLCPLIAAARLDKGRLVAFGHGGYLDGPSDAGETNELLSNIFRWAASENKAKPGELKIGVRGAPKLVEFLKQKGFHAIALENALTLESLKSFQAVMIPPGAPNATQTEALETYVRAGGAWIAGTPGWGWAQVNPGKDLLKDLPANKVFGKAGILWAHDTAAKTGKLGYTVNGVPSPLLNAWLALDAMQEEATQKRTLSAEERAQAQASLIDAVNALPLDESVLLPKLEKLLVGQEDKTAKISKEHPLTDKDGLAKLLLAWQIRKSKQLPPSEVKAHASAANFPGAVPADAKRVTKTVSIDTKTPGWHSLGLYAAPGEVITVKAKDNAIFGKAELRIGCHRDSLWDKAKWERPPEMTRTFALKTPNTAGVNMFGGPVYIEVHKEATPNVVELEIVGAVEAPLFIAGKTDLKEWRETIRHAPGPWAEIVSKKIGISTQSKFVRELDNPETLMQFWDDVADACADLANWPRERNRAERYVPDVQISAGYMHSGYPIMTHMDVAGPLVNEKELREKGNWGLFHEIGHNHQSGDWTFGGTTEVTVNLFTMYIFDTLVPKAEKRKDVLPDVVMKRMDKFIKSGAKFDEWTGDPFLALAMYVQLKDSFGWEAYKKVFAEYRKLPGAEKPKTDLEKHDQWMQRFSKTVGKNLAPFFTAWGIPTTEAARSSLKDLPEWLPGKM